MSIVSAGDSFNSNLSPSNLNPYSRVEDGNRSSNNHRPPIQNRTFLEKHKKKIGVGAGVLSAGALFIPGAAELVGAAKLITLIGSASVGGAVLGVIGIVFISAILFSAIACFLIVLCRNPKSAFLGAILGGSATTGIIFGIPGLVALITSTPIGWALGVTIVILVGAILGGVAASKISDSRRVGPLTTEQTLHLEEQVILRLGLQRDVLKQIKKAWKHYNSIQQLLTDLNKDGLSSNFMSYVTSLIDREKSQLLVVMKTFCKIYIDPPKLFDEMTLSDIKSLPLKRNSDGERWIGNSTLLYHPKQPEFFYKVPSNSLWSQDDVLHFQASSALDWDRAKDADNYIRQMFSDGSCKDISYCASSEPWEMRLKKFLTVSYDGILSQYANQFSYSIKNGIPVMRVPKLPILPINTIPDAALKELEKYGYLSLDNKPENFGAIKIENKYYVIPIDAKLIMKKFNRKDSKRKMSFRSIIICGQLKRNQYKDNHSNRYLTNKKHKFNPYLDV